MADTLFGLASTLLCFLVLFARVDCSNEKPPDLDDILKGGYAATDLQGSTELIVLVGSTGTGKSTLSKFVRQDRTLQIRENEAEDLIFVDNEVKIGSKNSHTSKTFYPNLDLDVQSNSIFVDCAGFRDTRSPQFDLVAGFLNKKILDAATKLKIVIVDNYSSVELNNIRYAFTNTLKHVAALVGSNMAALDGSIGLVATKIDSTSSDAKLKRKIRAFLVETQKYLEETRSQDQYRQKQLQLVEFLLKGENVALFRRPQELGDPWQIEALKKNYEDARQMIFNTLKFSSEFPTKFKVSVAPATVNFIKDGVLQSTGNSIKGLFLRLQQIALENFKDTVNVKMQTVKAKISTACDFCERKLALLDALDSQKQIEDFLSKDPSLISLVNDMRFQLAKYSFLYEVVDKDLNEMQLIVLDWFGHKKPLLDYISATCQYQSFLIALNSEFSTFAVQSKITSTSNLLSRFVDAKNFHQLNLSNLGFSDELNNAAKLQTSTEEGARDLINLFLEGQSPLRTTTSSEGYFHAQGRFVMLSQIKNHIYSQPLKEVMIVASQKIFLDCDLELQDTHLILFSPEVEIIGSRTFFLKGSDGQPHSAAAASNSDRYGLKGYDGAPGNSGTCSGYFFLHALTIQNAQHLTVKSVGGNGGNGQNGGKGFSSKYNAYPTIDGSFSESSDLRKKAENKGYSVDITSARAEGSRHEHELVTVKNTAEKPPTNGGNGGDAGAAAAFGRITIDVQRHDGTTVIVDARNGVPGKVGSGGSAGETAATCAIRYYECRSDQVCAGDRDGVYCTRSDYCDKAGTAHCNSKHPAARNGESGKSLGNVNSVPKHPPSMNLSRLFLSFLVYVLQNEKSVESEPNVADFIESFFTKSKHLSSETELKYYLEFLKITEALLHEAQLLSNQKYFHLKVYDAFRKTSKTCEQCDPAMLKAVDMMFVNRFHTLHSFSHGKQVVQLTSTINEMLQRMSSVTETVKSSGITQTVTSAKAALEAKITDAQSYIAKMHCNHLNELKSDVENLLNHILNKAVELKSGYLEKGRKLESLKDELGDVLKQKTILGVVNVFGQIAQTFYPPASAIASTAHGIGSSILDKRASTIESAARAVADTEASLMQGAKKRSEIYMDSLNQVVSLDKQVGGIISDRNRNFVSSSAQNAGGLTTGALKQLPGTFSAITKDIDTKIAAVEKSGGADSAKKISSMKTTKARLEVASAAAGVAGSVANIFDTYASDETKMKQIKDAIKRNSADLKSLANFENSIITHFGPFLDQMIEFYAKTKLSDHSTFMLEFQKIDVKRHARKLMSMLEVFSKDFIAEKSAFSDVFADWENFLATMIEAYDKIHELHYRSQLAEFIGEIHAGQCAKSLTSDQEACKLYLEVAASMESNVIVGEFVSTFAAYQLALFPHGGTKMPVLKSTLAQLTNSSTSLTTSQKAFILKPALETMRNDFADINDKIINHRDKDILKGTFNSKYASSRPFYKWPNQKFANEIKRLLGGEEVNFVASVLTPGVKNAVKFQTIMIKFTSPDSAVQAHMQKVLSHFQFELQHKGESFYRCGSTFYSIASESLSFKGTFELDETGDFVFSNRVVRNLKFGDVPLSPYTVWKFKLINSSEKDKYHLFDHLLQFANKVDLELIGTGSYIEDKASICDDYLGDVYNVFETLLQ